MTKGINYHENKPLYNSVIMGVFYFLLGWAEPLKYMFVAFMWFLPGFTFPLTTCYFNNEKQELSTSRIMTHLILSFGIYFGCLWIFTLDGKVDFVPVIAGIIGSLLFMLSTKLILNRNLSLFQILISAIVSGLAFLPNELETGKESYIGLALFLWTLANGILLNYEFRKSKKI